MYLDGFITMPTFRPDGRLDSLNKGGGAMGQMVDAMKQYKKETGNSPSAGNGKFSRSFINWNNSYGGGAIKPKPAMKPVTSVSSPATVGNRVGAKRKSLLGTANS